MNEKLEVQITALNKFSCFKCLKVLLCFQFISYYWERLVDTRKFNIRSNLGTKCSLVTKKNVRNTLLLPEEKEKEYIFIRLVLE